MSGHARQIPLLSGERLGEGAARDRDQRGATPPLPDPLPGGERGSAHGFTLLEVLVAFSIAALMLVALLRAFGDGLASAAESESQATAVLLAESALDAAGAEPLRDGAERQWSDGKFLIATAVRLYPADASSAAPRAPYDIAVTVRWREGGRERALALHSIRLGAPNAR
ncbi:MAG TPA: type II secretion system protein [Stellaceae bacterium]|nr:type II secretion system protein [Stellaceae bacterium]